jgi:predicted phage baseplate assembly protein
MPAQGGAAAESSAEARLRAPHAFRSSIARAITAQDYADIAGRHPRVARAAARLRWTGSWYEARVAIDPRGSSEPDAALLHEVEAMLYPYRRLGHDVAVVAAVYVPLDIALHVCLAPHATAGAVRAELLERLGKRLRADGSPGFFHPDRLDFGAPVYLSSLVALAQSVDGVQSVKVTRLQRLFEASAGELAQGLLPIGDVEIAQLDNDPNFPERGILTISTGGGR